ncbi:hypothetical protein D9619_012523 [Psilocybe cf. subviscida]|uniref:PCI domain-containing protein n=1 Tax=Psilocybe cf. subviscida TaxID=2480587 RepID=A0A8H5B8A0_9AGAR|nr:hypothetical protein D9619_012523 [Psilocybe cf. subviscida]
MGLFHPSPHFLAALTSARTAANSIYCPPSLQSSLNLQSGILHAEDKDYTTAYSCFFEAFESLGTHGEAEGDILKTDGGANKGQALGALKYMLLCKVMLNLMRDVESMGAIAHAHQNRNLTDFERALREYRDELSSDPTTRSHLAVLYETLLEQNFLRIVEPYSIAYFAECVGQDVQGE